MMTWITDRGESRYGPLRVTVLDDSESLDTLLANFEMFLLACGWPLPKGSHIGYEYEEYDDGTPGEYPEETT